MALCELERRNYIGKWSVSIKYQNLNSFKEGLILYCQSILGMRRIRHLHGSAHFEITLRAMESTSAEAFESELNIEPINLRLKELQQMEAKKSYQKKDQFITNNMRK